MGTIAYFWEQDFPLKLTDDHIVQEGIYFLNAQPFYGHLEIYLIQTDDHIVRKGI